MTNTEKFYSWWTKRVKGNFIQDESFDRISNQLDPVLKIKNIENEYIN